MVAHTHWGVDPDEQVVATGGFFFELWRWERIRCLHMDFRLPVIRATQAVGAAGNRVIHGPVRYQRYCRGAYANALVQAAGLAPNNLYDAGHSGNITLNDSSAVADHHSVLPPGNIS